MKAIIIAGVVILGMAVMFSLSETTEYVAPEVLEIEEVEVTPTEEELRRLEWEKEAEAIRQRHLDKLEREHQFAETEAQTLQRQKELDAQIKEIEARKKETQAEFEIKKKEHTDWMREYHQSNVSYWTLERVTTLINDYFPDAPIMIQVARGESGLKQWHADGRVVRGVVDNDDTGLMQINNRYWGDEAKRLGLDYENSIIDNVRMARHIKDTQGITAWVFYNDHLAMR